MFFFSYQKGLFDIASQGFAPKIYKYNNQIVSRSAIATLY